MLNLNNETMKKKICITLSRVFPQTHSRRGQPTGFSDKLANGTKIHTIRNNYDLWAVNAEKMQTGKYLLSVRQWIDKPYPLHTSKVNSYVRLNSHRMMECRSMTSKTGLPEKNGTKKIASSTVL